MTISASLPAHAARPALDNLSREIAGKSTKAPTFALLVDALTREAAIHTDEARTRAGTKRPQCKSDAQSKPPPAPAASEALAALALAPALPPINPVAGDHAKRSPDLAAPAEATLLDPAPLRAPAALALTQATAVPSDRNCNAAIEAPPRSPTGPNSSLAAASAPAPAQTGWDHRPPGIRQAQAKTFLGLDAAAIRSINVPIEVEQRQGLQDLPIDRATPSAAVAPAATLSSAATGQSGKLHSTRTVRTQSSPAARSSVGAPAPTEPAHAPTSRFGTRDSPTDALSRPVVGDQKGSPSHAAGAAMSAAIATVGFEPPANISAPAKVESLARVVVAGADDLGRTNAISAPPVQRVVKELLLDLAPENLGAVSLKMRLSEGKLAVVVEVSTASALKAVQGEHSAIAQTLAANAQPLESLVIRQSNPNHGDRHDASNSERSARDEQHRGSRDAAPQRGSAERREPRAASPPAPRRRADGLLV